MIITSSLQRIESRNASSRSFMLFSALALVGLSVSSWAFLILADGADFSELISPATIAGVVTFAKSLAGLDSEVTPAFFKLERWGHALTLASETLVMSILAAGISAMGVAFTVMPAARNIAFGQLSPTGWVWRPVFLMVRGLYVLTRGIPELIWAMLVIFVLNPGLIAGAFALAIHNFGIMGKLSAEVIEDMDPRPSRALRGVGADNSQLLIYGVLPMILPQILTYLFYRWEVIIRTTIVVAFVSAGGLGYDFRLHMSFFRYTEIALLLIVYILLVWTVDLVSIGLRRLAR